MFQVPESYRVQTGDFATFPRDGNNGLFLIPYGSNILQCIVSDGDGWEHVSVCVRFRNKILTLTPTWEQMNYVKDIFWSGEDTVIQFHPPKSEYVNNHPNVLHLWRPIGEKIVTPKSILVGIK